MEETANLISEDNNNKQEQESKSSTSLPSTSKNIASEKSSSMQNPDLSNFIKHEISKFENSLNSTFSTIINNKDDEISTLKEQINLQEQLQCEEKQRSEKLKKDLLDLKDKHSKDLLDLKEKHATISKCKDEEITKLKSQIKTSIPELKNEEKMNHLQSDNDSLVKMVKSLKQSILIYKNISVHKSKKTENLSKKLKEAKDAYKQLKEDHDKKVSNSLNCGDKGISASASLSSKRKNSEDSHSPAKISKNSSNAKNSSTPSFIIKDIETLLYTEDFLRPEYTNLELEDIAVDEDEEKVKTKEDKVKTKNDLDRLKKDVGDIVKNYLKEKCTKLSKKEIEKLVNEIKSDIKQKYLEKHKTCLNITVNDEAKVKIKDKIKLYIKIQQEVKNILGNFFLGTNSEIEIEYSREFYKKIRDSYDAIPSNLRGGMTIEEEDRMTLTKDFLKQMSDSITFQMTRNTKS